MSALSGLSGSPDRRRNFLHYLLQYLLDPDARLGRSQYGIAGIETDDVFNFRLTRSGSALGRSILLMTGKISRSFSRAKYTLANVCASMPWAASTTRSAPSQAARLRDTSYVKST